MPRIVTFEQFNTLTQLLAAVGVQNGDIAEIVFRHVGIWAPERGQACLAFCPSLPYDVRILKRGHPDERRLPFPTLLFLGKSLCEDVQRNAPRKGFLDIAVQIHAHPRGIVNFSGTILNAENVPGTSPVHALTSYRDWQDIITPSLTAG